MLFEFIALVSILLILWTIQTNKKIKGYPNGPLAFPIVGNLPYIAGLGKEGMHKYFIQLNKKYGKIFSFQFGPKKAIVINDYKLIKEAWNSDLLSGRPKSHAVAERTGGVCRGIMFQDGDEWNEQKRFTLRHLREFGYGKRSMERLFADEALELLEGFKSDEGKPITTQLRFNIAVVNSLWYVISGQQFRHDDPKLKEIVASVQRLFTSNKIASPVFFIPWLAKYFPKLSGWKQYQDELSHLYNFLKEVVQERLDNYEEGRIPQDFMDTYIDAIKKTNDPSSSFYQERGELTLIAVLQDLFTAGAETTSTSLTWALLYLAIFPDKQEKVFEEIDRVLNGVFPTIEDRTRLPYVESFINETLRHSAIAPLGLFHYALDSVNFHEFHIPKGTFLVSNLHAANHDIEYWGDPKEFRPERFLTSDGNGILKHDAFIPFSYGKRICLAESLARNEMFIFITTILQEFRIETDPNSPKPTTDQLVTLTAAPCPHKLVLNQRKRI